MAGDWLKVRCDLHEDPAVIGIASACALDEDTVVGKLIRVWRWANRQSRDGHARVTEVWLDRHVGVQGFAKAMCDCGWLIIETDGLKIPNWDNHNSQSAKARALSTMRQRHARVTQASHPKRYKSVTREEKRRDELSKDNSLPDAFDKFWKAFPKGRRKSPGDAKKAFANAVKKTSTEILIAAAVEYAASAEGQGRYVKMPSSWLNQECWNDDREAWARNQTSDGKPQRKSVEELVNE